MRASTICLALVIGTTTAVSSLAGESTLTRTFQPLDGRGSAEIQIEPVMCHDWYAHGDYLAALSLIAAKNIPPTNAPKAVEDINLASAYGIHVSASSIEKGVLHVTLDLTHTQRPGRMGYSTVQVVRATMECVRRLAAERHWLIKSLRVAPEGDQEIAQAVEDFQTYPKDKEFPWR
ncbi:MAG: hypothetical protein QOD99_1276 [Chthoniobacter sp.]|jgi:hypothetical protein|nr:hypothetical protein [Chthoniobacter sp.]